MKGVGEDEYSDSFTSDLEEEELDEEERNGIGYAEIGGIEECQQFKDSEEMTKLISDFRGLGVSHSVETCTQKNSKSTDSKSTVY